MKRSAPFSVRTTASLWSPPRRASLKRKPRRASSRRSERKERWVAASDFFFRSRASYRLSHLSVVSLFRRCFIVSSVTNWNGRYRSSPHRPFLFQCVQVTRNCSCTLVTWMNSDEIELRIDALFCFPRWSTTVFGLVDVDVASVRVSVSVCVSSCLPVYH